MPNLQISSTDDAIHRRVTFLIPGTPKIGKTSLLKTLKLDNDKQLFYIAADPGQLTLRDRSFAMARPENQRIDMTFLDDVYSHTRREVGAGKYKWVSIDGLDSIATAVLNTLKEVNKNALQAYGQMAEYMEDWICKMRDIAGASIVMITHIDTQTVGEEVQYVPMMPGKEILKKINGWFDEIGFYRFVRTGDKTYERVIQFKPDPDPRYTAGDRSGALEAFESPNLQTIFDKIHNAGLVTEGKAIVERSQGDMDLLAEIAKSKKRTTQQVIALSATLFNGKYPRFLDDEQFEKLKASL